MKKVNIWHDGRNPLWFSFASLYYQWKQFFVLDPKKMQQGNINYEDTFYKIEVQVFLDVCDVPERFKPYEWREPTIFD